MKVSDFLVLTGGIIMLFIIFVILGWGYIYFETVMGRRIYEQSYQRVEALREKVNTLEAAIAEVEDKLKTATDPDEIRELEARLRTLRVQLSAAKARLEEVR